MDIPYTRWYPVIARRRSRRQYDEKALAPDDLAGLQKICADFRLFPEARAVLVTESPDKVFIGAVGHYGKIKGAPAFIAFIGSMDSPGVHEKTGYLGEGVILEATAHVRLWPELPA